MKYKYKHGWMWKAEFLLNTFIFVSTKEWNKEIITTVQFKWGLKDTSSLQEKNPCKHTHTKQMLMTETSGEFCFSVESRGQSLWWWWWGLWAWWSLHQPMLQHWILEEEWGWQLDNECQHHTYTYSLSIQMLIIVTEFWYSSSYTITKARMAYRFMSAFSQAYFE